MLCFVEHLKFRSTLDNEFCVELKRFVFKFNKILLGFFKSIFYKGKVEMKVLNSKIDIPRQF